MAKFAGFVGYATQTDDGNGIVTESYVEKKLRGDLLKAVKSYEEGTKVNDDITLSHRISIVADKYAYSNFDKIRYVVLYGVKWKVTSIEIIRPRLVLTVGGVFNG